MNYIIYQITNLVTGKYYVGCHQTANLDDGYFGSGKCLPHAINKYGKENFKKEVLYNFATPEEMFEKEAEIVNEEFVNNKNTYNLKTGGTGGWSHVNTGDEKHRARCKYANSKVKNKFDLREAGKKTQFGADKERTTQIVELTKTPEARAKRKKTFSEMQHQQGEKNSQFGKMWIHSLSEQKSKKILKSDPIPEGWLKGRKMKF